MRTLILLYVLAIVNGVYVRAIGAKVLLRCTEPNGYIYPLSGSRVVENDLQETWIRDNNFVYEKNHIDREVFLHRIGGEFDVVSVYIAKTDSVSSFNDDGTPFFAKEIQTHRARGNGNKFTVLNGGDKDTIFIVVSNSLKGFVRYYMFKFYDEKTATLGTCQ